MASFRAIFQAHFDGVFPESIPLDLQWSSLSSPAQALLPLVMSAGDNLVTPPPGTKLIMMMPPAANGVVTKIKGAFADTGITLLPNAPSVIPIGGGSFIVNVATQITIVFAFA